MKVKYYRLRECLSAGEAMDYIRLLTSVDLTEADFMLLLLEERLLDCYVLIPRHKPKDYPLATGRQRLGDFLADDFEWRHDQQSTELIFHPFLYHEDKTIPRRKTILLYGCTDFEDNPTHWNADTSWFYPEALIYFLRGDVEALAAKMNNQPSHQTLQEENQRLQQKLTDLKELNGHLSMDAREALSELDRCRAALDAEIEENESSGEAWGEAALSMEAMMAEVESLKAENAKLKADDEINPRKEDTYLQMIAAMAIKLGHDFSVSKNGTNKEIRDKLFEIHDKVVSSESAIRNGLNRAKETLPTSLTRPKSK